MLQLAAFERMSNVQLMLPGDPVRKLKAWVHVIFFAYLQVISLTLKFFHLEDGIKSHFSLISINIYTNDKEIDTNLVLNFLEKSNVKHP